MPDRRYVCLSLRYIFRRNKTEDNAVTKDFFIGMLAGAAAGGIFALMFAPMEGSRARNIIKEAAHATCAKAKSAPSKVGYKRSRKVNAIRQAI
jgi:gas vesicle protein